jgi:hypothetical protein
MSVLKVRNAANTDWIEVGGLAQDMSAIFDDDGDTRIMCEESADEDVIRMDVGGSEVVQVRPDNLNLGQGSVDEHAMIHFLYYSHDNVNMAFDAYYNGADWISSDQGSNYLIQKNSDLLNIHGSSGCVAGESTAWANIWRLTPQGERTMDEQPYVHVTCLATNLETSVFTTVNWTEVEDIGANFSSNVYTAPVDGIYHITCTLLIGPTDEFDIGNEYFQLVFYKNGGPYRYLRHYPDNITAHYPHINFTGQIRLDANDTFILVAMQNSGATIAVYADPVFSHMYISLMQ